MKTTYDERSPMDIFRGLPEKERKAVTSKFTKEQWEYEHYKWRVWARPKQRTPRGNWRTWLIRSGRGWGKTRVGAEWIREKVEKGCRRIALVGRTAADVRDVMIEGESGIMSVFPPHQAPVYEPSKRQVTFHTGAIAKSYSADEPKLLRGPQHDAAWCDELAAWRYIEAWDQLQFGLRMGDNPQVIVTTTPKPVKIIRDLVADTTCHVTNGSTYENQQNLAQAYIERVRDKYEGTSLGRQELHGEVLEEAPGALWARSIFEQWRHNVTPPTLDKVIVGVDPAVTSKSSSDETGIVVAARRDRFFVLGDHSGRYTPDGWARRAIECYHQYNADRIVAETNQGGDMVKSIIHGIDPTVAYRGVHASRGKATRAEPIAALYEQGKVSHVGALDQLEDQCCNWVPGEGESPDRVDALVWAMTELNDRATLLAAPADLTASSRWRL